MATVVNSNILDSKRKACFDAALENVLTALSFEVKYCTELLSDDTNNMIVFSWHKEEVRKLYESLVLFAYSESDRDANINRRFTFIAEKDSTLSSEENHLFWMMARLFESLKIATVVTLDSDQWVSKLIDWLKQESATSYHYTSRRMRDEIETRCCNSGPGEMLEMLFRDKTKEILHTKLSVKENEKNKISALRLLLGAYVSGDIDCEFIKDKSVKDFLPEGVTKNVIKEVINFLNENSKKEPLSLNDMLGSIDEMHKSCLSEYMSGRNILIIEDRLVRDGWDVTLPVLFGSKDQDPIPENCTNKEYTIASSDGKEPRPGFTITHIKSCRESDGISEDELATFDLILLDLYSSQQPEHESHSLGTHAANIPHSIWSLMKRVNELHKDTKYMNDGLDRWAPKPAVVAFTAETNGSTVLKLLRDLGVSTFFFKVVSDVYHKAAYYSSFRNAIVEALTRQIAIALKVPFASHDNHFNKWMANFNGKHRPTVLSLMKHFRYFEAGDIVKILDEYISKSNIIPQHSNDIKSGDKNGSKKVNCSKLVLSYLGRPNKSGPITLSLFGKTEWLQGQDTENVKFKTYTDLQKYLEILVDDKTKKFIEETSWPENKPIDIAFVDDVSGTGGQAVMYCDALFVRHLGWGYESSKWKCLCKYVKENKIKFHLVYALGIGKAYSQELERPIRIGGAGNSIYVRRHIALKTTALGDIYPNKLPSYVENVLKSYKYIVHTRDGYEFNCQFEPYGWRGEKRW